MREAGGEWADKQLAIMATKSPTSLKVAHQQFKRGAGLEFNDCMRMEYRMASVFARGHDLYEGIRAVVIDKDQRPKWRPASLAEVGDGEVARYFETPPHDGDLVLPGDPVA